MYLPNKLCAVEALCEKCIPNIKDASFRSFKASSTKHACDVKDRRKKHRNQKGKHDHQVARDGVFANRMSS